MSERIAMIDVDHLGIDAVNIRGGVWDRDEELIESIKENGIIDPLIVRPAKPSTGVKYAIVCGSRRYNAAIEVGLTKVPCIIREMDDITATGLSIMENKHRRDIPGWKYALKIGEMYETLNHRGNRPEIIKVIMAKTGFSDTSVYRYLEIAQLPREIIELMKEPAERSEVVKELLKALPQWGAEKTLDIDKAAIIARKLGMEGYSLKKMLEVAVVAMSVPRERMAEFLEQVKVFPKMSALDVYTEKVIEIPKGWRFMIYFDSTLARAATEACIKKQMDRKELISYYFQEGLRRDGFL